MIEYARDGTSGLRRLWIRWTALLVVLLIVGSMIFHYAPGWWRQFRFLAAQRQCAQYVAPAQQVVFEAAADLPASPPADFVDFRGPYFPDGTRAHHAGIARRAPDCWPDWMNRWAVRPSINLLMPTGLAPVSPLFLHARKTPKGADRIVALTQPWIAQQNATDVQWSFDYVAITPGTRTTPPQLGVEHYVNLFLKQGQPLRFFAGQPDPADPTHFTLAYDVDGTPGATDFHLVDFDPNPIDARVVQGSPGINGGLWLFRH